MCAAFIISEYVVFVVISLSGYMHYSILYYFSFIKHRVTFYLACSHGEVRLLAYKPVEVCVDGIWAGICSNAINASAVAKILCKQLIGVENSCKL
jgi:hypothetical protein